MISVDGLLDEQISPYMSIFNDYIIDFGNVLEPIEILRKRESIYHYTSSIDAVINILCNHELWLTDARYLNDMTELEYIKRLAHSNRLNTKVREYLSNWSSNPKEIGCCFVMSFSKKSDYLPLWATFTKMKGFSIGFQRIDLENIASDGFEILTNDRNFKTHSDSYKDVVEKGAEFSEFGLRVLPVVYDEERQIEILNTVVNNGIDRLKNVAENEKPDMLYRFINRLLAYCSIFFKDKCFEYEAEQRYVCFSQQSHHHLEYNYVFEYDNEAAFIPRLKVKFNSRMPLESVTFAPLANDIVIKDKLKYHLIKAGYDDMKFYESQVQLRRY